MGPPILGGVEIPGNTMCTSLKVLQSQGSVRMFEEGSFKVCASFSLDLGENPRRTRV